MAEQPESGGLRNPQAEGSAGGGRDGEPQILSASQELARARALAFARERRVLRLLDRTVATLVRFLLLRGPKTPVTREEMMKCVGGDLKRLFPEIVAKASMNLRYVLGFELKMHDLKSHTYILVNKIGSLLEDEEEELKNLGVDGPILGLLMMILGLIFMKGNRVRESQVWQMLRRLGLPPTKYHSLFGYPKRLIMEDFVHQQFLTYRWVPNSCPPECEFSWGPRSNLEISKMKILRFVAKLHKKPLQHWPVQYQEALADEAEKERAKAQGQSQPSLRIKTRARASVHSWVGGWKSLPRA